MDPFMNLPDIGKLFESARRLVAYRDERDKLINPRLDPVQNPYNSIEQNLIDPSPHEIAEFAETAAINEMALNAAHRLLYKAALEHDDIKEDLRSIFLRVILYYGTDIQKRRDVLVRHQHEHEAKRKSIMHRNELRVKVAQASSTAFKNKLNETEDLLKVRKAKMVRSMNKALAVAGGPDFLHPVDAYVFRIMQKHDWVGFDGSIFCCKEQNVMAEDLGTSIEIIQEILNFLKSQKQA